MKKAIIFLGIVSVGVLFNIYSVQNVQAKELADHECAPGYYYKKGGFMAPGTLKAGGFCVPIGNIGKVK
ncbi:hypothetical protein [Enterococcus bulliens]